MDPTTRIDEDTPAPHHHLGLRQRLDEAVGVGHPPVFEPVDPGAPEGIVLRAVLALARESDLVELDVNRTLAAGTMRHNFARSQHCSLRAVDADGQTHRFCSNWSPTGRRDDPRVGFGDGPDSTLLGHFPRRVMPDDWRTDALLMVVTSPFVHLSVDRRDDPPLVRGAIEEGLSALRFVELTQD